jgi:hypothetical protein
MSKPAAPFPDISDILEAKAQGRRDSAARTLDEKIARIEAMRERLAPLKRLREERDGRAAGSGRSQVSKTK